MLYKPREDSFLLQKYVKRFAYGNVLDIGTGSGILALDAAKKKNVKKVVAVDIQKKVIKHCKENIKDKKIEFFASDLFSIFKTTTDKKTIEKQSQKFKNFKSLKKTNKTKKIKKFDTIIFNPPYLPEDVKLKDLTLDGGKKGYEVLERFFDDVNDHLSEKGVVLVVFSSLTKKDKVDEFIRNNLLEFKLLEKQHIFFEDLFVYLIKKTDLLRKLEKKKVKNLRYFTHGHRGILFTGGHNNKKIVIKAKLAESKAVGRINNEIKWLKLLNKHKVGPKLLFYENDFFVYEFVKGEFIMPYFEKSNKTEIKKILKIIFKQLHALDKLGVDKEEMHHPFKHVLIGKKIVLLDFERCHKTKKPKNVTQFLMCLIRKDMSNLLDKKGINLNKGDMISIAKEYKQTYNLKILEGLF